MVYHFDSRIPRSEPQDHLCHTSALGRGRSGGPEEKSRARKGPRKVTLRIQNEIRKLQENPLLGEWRMSAALSRMGVEVSPATCGRIMAANRQLYGLEKSQRQPRAKLEMPFKASHRHEYWSCDIR